MLSTVSDALFFGGSYAVIALIPGPNFMLVSFMGLNHPRSHALCAAFGVSSGVASLSAVAQLLPQSDAGGGPLLHVLQAVFAVLLLSIGVRAIWTIGRSIRQRGAAPAPVGVRRSPSSATYCLFAGLCTALSNPVTLAFMIGTAVSGHRGTGGGLDVPRASAGAIGTFIVAVVWFGGVALAASQPLMRAAAQRYGGLVTPIVGLVLIWWSLRLMMTALA
ncbi:LysE family transporter [Paenirhodobacter sp.]|uniref:LysE family transporter n=1 Tax=Paenirhodobacter sp. TaxID=1965326 RepID=UPI003B3DB21A